MTDASEGQDIFVILKKPSSILLQTTFSSTFIDRNNARKRLVEWGKYQVIFPVCITHVVRILVCVTNVTTFSARLVNVSWPPTTIAY